MTFFFSFFIFSGFKGFGLGLSIVKNGVELHDGSLYIDSKVDAGTKVEVVF